MKALVVAVEVVVVVIGGGGIEYVCIHPVIFLGGGRKPTSLVLIDSPDK